MGIGTLSAGKYYDAKKTKTYCDSLKTIVDDYGVKAKTTHLAYNSFFSGTFFMGYLANAMKNFVKNGAGKALNEVTDIHNQMIFDQNYLMESFESMVDSSPIARIENDTMELIDKDFKGYFSTFNPIAQEVARLVNALNAEFGGYDHFPQPDSETAISAFKVMCGGDGEAGFLKTCLDNFLEFDYTVNNYLKGRDTADHADDLYARFGNTSEALSAITGEGEEVSGKYEVSRVGTLTQSAR